MFELFLRKILFSIDPEMAHHVVCKLLRLPLLSKLLGWYYRYEHPALRRVLFGLTFPNPIGMAAGFDKNAEIFSQLGELGFGFVEIGTITPKPQAGNLRPRLFRLLADEALINRMGFNNDGLEAIKNRLKDRRRQVIIGGNIGKNRETPNEEAFQDYIACFDGLFEWVDYFAINVSSPNTPNLRALQEKDALKKLLNHLQKLNRSKPCPKPILLKIAPDLNEAQLDDIIDIVIETQIDGVIATNTTISRENLKSTPQTIQEIGEGGLSGRPLSRRSTEIIRYLHQKSSGAFPIIGVGGIHGVADALEKLEAGASLIQIYTGFVYKGPTLIKQIKQAIKEGQ